MKTACLGICAAACALQAAAGVTFDFSAARGFNTNNVTPVTVQLAPHGFLDGTYFAPSGQCVILHFAWHGAKDPTGLALELPPGITLLDSAVGPVLQREKLPSGGTRTTFKLRNRFLPPRSSVAFLICSSAPIGAQGAGSLVALKDATPYSNVEPVTFTTVAPVKAAAVPKRAINGIDVTERFTEFPDLAANRALATTMADIGVRNILCSMYSGATLRKRNVWREAGIAHLTGRCWWIANGFQMSYPFKRDKANCFVPKDDPSRKPELTEMLSRATCPVSVYAESPDFRTNAVPELTARLQGFTGVWANWEPYQFVNQGCCCARCREAFVAYMKDEDPETVRKGWPANVLRGGAYARYAEDFRSREHAKAVAVIDKYVRVATGGVASDGFVAGVEWSEVCRDWRVYNHGPETKETYYAETMKWIDPWGPYVKWDTRLPYVCEKRLPLAHYVAARDMREQIDRDYPLGRRPKLMSFPQGYQCGSWVVQPEWLEMGLDSFFFNQWEQNVVYFFPEGYDARYLRAFANATARAARYEDAVFDGVRVDNFVRAVPFTPYARPCKDVSAYIPHHVNVSPLQLAAYDYAGQRIVALFNFWEKGTAFAHLTCERLAPGEYDVYDETGTCWAKTAEKPAWRAEDFRAGIPVEVAAARTAVFEIVPATSTAVRPAKMRTVAETLSRANAARPALKREADRDAALEKSRPPATRDHMATL